MACTHDHSCEQHDCSSSWSLYKHVDLSKVSSLNEAVPGSVRKVLKAWERRLDSSEGYLESNEGDPELIVFIPFTSDAKIRSISIVGGADGTSPSKMRVFINRDGIDFSVAQSMQAVQEWDLVENMQGILEYQTKFSRFQSVANITLHFPDSFGGDTTQIHYIGFKGEATQLKRDAVVNTVYELMPNPSDHKLEFAFGFDNGERSGFERRASSMEAAAPRPRISSFSRNTQSASHTILPRGVKTGPNSTAFVSSGIPTLDAILGGGYCLGSLIMVMEDPEAPHHMLLLRTFMSQGIVHDQPLLYASPVEDPRRFLGTLPSPACSTTDKSPRRNPEEDMGLRIAWQYKKYFDETHHTFNSRKDNEIEYCSEFDLRKPLQRQFIAGRKIKCISIQKNSDLAAFHDHCGVFLNQYARKEGSTFGACRIAIQSFCVPQCEYFDQEWQVLSFLSSLRSMVKSSNSVAVLTFSPSLLSPSSLKRWQHLADTLISVRAIPDDDKDLAKLLTGYQDMVGLLNIHKIARPNIQVPIVLDATMFSIKLQKRKYLVLECLNQAPVDGSGGSSYATSGTGSCSGASKIGSLNF